ncbi:MAG: gephyrin-like molybdotransferase Glp [Pseudomonadales bacterium]
MTEAETRLDLDEALRAILNDTHSITATAVVELPAAAGRVLAGELTAPLSLPPFPASAMDGYAVRSDDAVGPPPYRFRVAGSSFAGRPMTDSIPTGACIRIFTGAPVPEQLDTVIIQEECERDGAFIVVDRPIEAGAHVRPVGHDVTAGARLMTSGRLLSAFDIGWLAACGMTQATVRKRPTVGLFSNGDELAEPGQKLRPGQIFDANRVALRTLLQQLPVHVIDYGIAADDPAELRDVLQQADASCDLVITSGGVSVGEADWVKDAVGEIGTVQLWRLNLKPGKPLAYGRLRHAAFFGLPGNPVSALVTTLMLVMPTLQRLCGADPAPPLGVPAVLRGTLRHQPGREEFQRGTLVNSNGALEVTVTGDQSSNRLSSFAAANCLIRIAKDCGDLSDGARVTALPFRGLL